MSDDRKLLTHLRHTPGPWHATDCRHQKGGQIRIFPNERTDCGGNIANVLASNLCCEGNATLIATAPDLLAALEAWEHWYSEDSTEQNRDDAREVGLRAIAKAKGKT